jgi:octaprenyl-diphosphate synthase
MLLAKELLENDLKIFEKKFAEGIKSNTRLVDGIMKYLIKQKGKQIRPLFALLSAKLCGSINESTYQAATLVELLHTATLVHDDVVDESHMRRSFFSINALWGKKAAVLAGDYLLAKGLLLSLENDHFFILKILSQAVRDMSEGELLQLEKARRLDITEEIYFEIITKKTASLISSACAVGAFSAHNNMEQKELFALFGKYAGIAFQIKDDLLDYAVNDIGKPTGNDIKERKLTLPLIYTLQQCSSADKRFIINTVKNNNNNQQAVQKLMGIINDTGGITYTQEKLTYYIEQAINSLQTLPDSKEKQAMIELVHYITLRNK